MVFDALLNIAQIGAVLLEVAQCKPDRLADDEMAATVAAKA